jgi:hypothetical protein
MMASTAPTPACVTTTGTDGTVLRVHAGGVLHLYNPAGVTLPKMQAESAGTAFRATLKATITDDGISHSNGKLIADEWAHLVNTGAIYLMCPETRLNTVILLNDCVCLNTDIPQTALDTLVDAVVRLYGADMAKLGGVRPVDAAALVYDTKSPLWVLLGPVQFNNLEHFKALAFAVTRVGVSWDAVGAVARGRSRDWVQRLMRRSK